MRVIIEDWELGDWSSDEPVVLRIGDRFERCLASVDPALDLDANFRKRLGEDASATIDAETYNNSRGSWTRWEGVITQVLAIMNPSTEGSPTQLKPVRSTLDRAGRSTGDAYLIDVDPL